MGHTCCPAEQKFDFTFSKYHGNANDFIIVNLADICATQQIEKTVQWFSNYARHLCDRNRGIGADGIILVEQSHEYLAIWVINADGSFAQNCGNGLRCVARWYFDENEHHSNVFIKLAQKVYECVKEGSQISVFMGESFVQKRPDFHFHEEQISALVYQVHLGNDHLVFFLNRWPQDLVKLHSIVCEKLGACDSFNMNYAVKESSAQVLSQVFERGVGLTQSCGSGACATASALLLNDSIIESKEVSVLQPGGEVYVLVTPGQISAKSATFHVRQTGEAAKVFDGQGQFTF